MKLDNANMLFFHGIAGTGMRGLAWFLEQDGKEIRGTDTLLLDLPDTFQVAPEGEAAELLDGCDIYVHTDAISLDHPLALAAKERGLLTLAYHEALGEVAANFTTVAVAGTHGKSSTAAFLAHILVGAGLDPNVLLGASVPTWPGKHARRGPSNLFVVEADEYRDHFLTLRPQHLIVTNIEHDHPDFFPSLKEAIASFQTLVDLLPTDGALVLPEGVGEQLNLPMNTQAVSPKPLPAAPLPGEHMQMNAALAIAMAKQLGVESNEAEEYLATFPGLSRRFEALGTVGKAEVISDYAHHPTEIAATLAAARLKYPGKRIAVIFEAHTAERLETFSQAFADVLSEADGVLLYPPFIPGGRSQKSEAVVTALVDRLRSAGRELHRLVDEGELPDGLAEFGATYDVILACTAGTLDQALRKTVSVD